jgi:hypothetical protein
MIEVIVSADFSTRTKKRNELLATYRGEIITLDDMTASIARLEEYAYPSLFSIEMPIIHSVYVLEEYGDVLTKQLLATLIASPSIFLFEEKALSAAIIKTLEKEGGIVHQFKEVKNQTKQSTIFEVTNALTAPNKKERWLAYQKAIQEHAAEALIGILYWKLRQLIEKSGSNTAHYKAVYKSLMDAHKQSWKRGTPLEMAIEKVILE